MLTPEQYMEVAKRHKEFMREHEKQSNEIRKQELQKLGIKVEERYIEKQNFHGDCDSVNSLENGPATVLYAIVMIGSLIFKAWWMIWIVASIIYFRFITRHN